MKDIRFSVYNHRFVLEDGQLINRKFIVLKKEGQLIFTDFHKYVRARRQVVKNISDDGNNRFDFVVHFLNYIFFDMNIGYLKNLEVHHVKTYLNHYGKGSLPGDKKGRTKSTVQQCVATIMDFLEEYISQSGSSCKITIEQLYKWQLFRDKNGVSRKRKVPVFDVVYINKPKDIFRDIPNEAFEMLLSHIAEHHKNILMLVVASAFAGLRPSEACNLRREDSPLGPGILFEMYENQVHSIELDLRKELCLRSDLKSTGRIKKERLQKVPTVFINAFFKIYEDYMSTLSNKKYEADYGALTVNCQGKAMSYQSYYDKFRKIVREEMIPIFLKSDDAETVNYGRLLMENNISPHVFRHWFTVQLVLAGYSEQDLMNARGDKSVESAATYVRNKGELEKMYRKVNNEMHGYLYSASEKLMKTKVDNVD